METSLQESTMPRFHNMPIRVTTDGLLVNNTLAMVSEPVSRYLKG